MPDNLLVWPEDGYTFMPTGLQIAPGMDFDTWEAVGKALIRIADAIQWAIGDWIAYGEREYGEKYAQAIEETGKAAQTLANYVWVANAFDFSRRRENLTFSHHAEVAALPEREQDILLDAAEEMIATEGQPRSTAWLRARVQEARGMQRPALACPKCGYIFG